MVKDNTTKKNDNYCAFIHSGSYPNPRIFKNIEVCKELGYRVVYISAIRYKALRKKEKWHGIEINRLGFYYPQSSLLCLFGNLWFNLSVFIWLINKKPELIHASDLESMFGAVAYKLIRRKVKLLFNIHDNFSLRYNIPKFIKSFLKYVEIVIGKFADAVILPDEMRLELLKPWVPKKYFIIYNSPLDPGYNAKKLSGKLKIFASGWITWTRGFDLLYRLINNRKDVELVICGSGSNCIVKTIKSWPRTEFYGYLQQKESLNIGKTCDIIFCFYDPSIEINIYAAPNKLFDALALGRPIIINEEIKVARIVKENKVGFCLKYGDYKALYNLIDFILSKPEQLLEMGQRARNLYESKYHWSKIKEVIIEAFKT